MSGSDVADADADADKQEDCESDQLIHMSSRIAAYPKHDFVSQNSRDDAY